MKTQTLLKSIFSTASIALLLLMVSCDAASNPSALVGHWLHESGGTDKVPQDVELFKDGTGVCDGGSISWKVENKRFIIQSSSFGMASDYEISGARLILTNNDEKVTYLDINNKKSLQKGTFTDSRDGKKYGTVKIGDQTWMAENLNYEAEGKCYDNNPTNCQKYGRLYIWGIALEICPKGWHLPSYEEWQTLVNFAGGKKIVGKKLKARSGWNSYEGKSGNGTDIFGFSALPGGCSAVNVNGAFVNVGVSGNWWSSTEYGISYAYSWYMFYWGASVGSSYDGTSQLYSVRCVKD